MMEVRAAQLSLPDFRRERLDPAPEVTMLTELLPLDEICRLNTGLLRNALAGVDDASARRKLHPDINPVAYLVIHLLDARFSMARMIGAPAENPHQAAWDAASSFDSLPGVPPLEELLTLWNGVSTALADQLPRITAADLATPAPHPFPVADSSRLGGLAFLLQHESYHLGQLGLLRRMLGLPAMVWTTDTPHTSDSR
mgnify:CR=1 FL=1